MMKIVLHYNVSRNKYAKLVYECNEYELLQVISKRKKRMAFHYGILMSKKEIWKNG